jgi:hypothetical protein
MAKIIMIIDGEEYVLSELPPLTDGRKFLSIERQTPSYMAEPQENKAEDWVIYISARYQYEYQK